MTISTFDAARTLGHYSNWSLTNLQMQKILYLSHMVYLDKTNGTPLVNEEFESWDYGPVLPSLYHRIKFYGSEPVRDVFHNNKILTFGKEAEILKEAAHKFSHVHPGSLIDLTHRKDGAWDQTYFRGARNRIIPNEKILEEYKTL